MDQGLYNTVLAIPDPFRTAWLADLKASSGGWDDEDVELFVRAKGQSEQTAVQNFLMKLAVHVGTNVDRNLTAKPFNEPIDEFLQQCGNDKALVSGKRRELQDAQFGRHRSLENICDIPDVNGRLPLLLASPYPDTVTCLIKHGADINKKSRIISSKYTSTGTVPESPLVSILSELAAKSLNAEIYENISRKMLQSAQILISEGADLSAKGNDNKTLLHLAARIRDLKLFKALCLSSDWDITARDSNESTSLHHLFHHPRPKTKEKTNDVLEICRMMMKMKRSDQDDLVNAQDKDSRNPLSWAVSGGFYEALELLIDLGADIHDDDSEGMNCFHLLAIDRNREKDEAWDLKVADVLFRAGVDITKRTTLASSKDQPYVNPNSRLNRDYGDSEHETPRDARRTPLELAVRASNWHLADFILDKYAAIGEENPDNHPLMLQNPEGQTILIVSILEIQEKHHTEKARRFVQRVLKVVEDQPSLLDLVTTVDDEKRSPIWYAVRSQDFDMVKALVDVNPDITTYDIYRQGPLEHTAHNFQFAARQLISGVAASVGKLKDILEYLILQTTPSSLFYLETIAFARGDDKDGSPADKLDMKKIISHYDGFRDEHGWTVHDLLKALEREFLIPDGLRKKEAFSSPEQFTRPSRIGYTYMFKHVEGQGSLSEDGLRYYIQADPGTTFKKATENRWASDSLHHRTSEVHLLADHPIPPVDKTFYYEVEIRKPENTSADDESDGFWLEACIGLNRFVCGNRTEYLPPPFILWLRPGSRRVRLQNDDLCLPPYFVNDMPSERWPKTDATVVGCGVNFTGQSIFWTLDGKMVVAIRVGWMKRFFPYVQSHRKSREIKFNFGSESFAFTPANDKEWQWDGILRDGDFEVPWPEWADFSNLWTDEEGNPVKVTEDGYVW
ncbi:hypothetical protein TWF694_008333 [Orbilia ellipsospora]|uniref:Uncharacterized protein n=1 Tax=Orbilia ellipsospora TaxID=2528407 RepID=A0AAV9XJ59_9PEZI